MNNVAEAGKRPLVYGWVGFGLSLALLACALFFGGFSGSFQFSGISLVFGLTAGYSLITVGQAYIVRRRRLEEESVREQSSDFGRSELFSDSADDAVDHARRVERIYLTYLVPAFVFCVAFLIGLLALLKWRLLKTQSPPETLADPAQYTVLSFGIFVICLLLGSYFVGKSRGTFFRWLRPLGALFLLGGFMFALAGFGLLVLQWQPQYIRWDIYIARIQLVIAMLLAAEAIILVIVDFYRPRVPGEELKPVHESRLLTIFTEPGGIARNIALSLDYQFGFEVSEAKFYRFFERTMIPLLVFMGAGLWLMTSVVIIDVDESGIRERFGRVVAGREQVLGPGLYFKLPLPFEKIHTYPTGKVQSISIGYTSPEEAMDDQSRGQAGEDPDNRVILWTRAHRMDETRFVVPVGSDVDTLEPDISDTGPRPVPVSFMSASIPVYYRVVDLYTYLFKFRDPQEKLEKLATREVFAYMATVDLFDLLTEKRKESGRILEERIQKAAGEMGVEIIFVGLEGLHPPIEVGASFNEVVSASEEKHTKILQAEQYAIKRQPEARAEAFRIRSQAEMYRLNRIQLARAEGERFLHQLAAFRAAPGFYPLRAYLDVMEEEGNDVRKYILGMPFADQVMILDLEEKLRPDLTDINLE